MGVDLSPERRARLAELARRAQHVRAGGPRVRGPPLRGRAQARACARTLPGHVIQVNSLSKVVGGGLRVGWIAGRGPVLERLSTLKQASDFHTPTLVQHIAARYLATDGYERHLAAQPAVLPRAPRRPDGGAGAPPGRRVRGHLAAGRPPRVGHARRGPSRSAASTPRPCATACPSRPGGAVTAERRQRTSLRLSFSLVEPEELDEGVRRLARALREVRRRDRTAVAAPLS